MTVQRIKISFIFYNLILGLLLSSFFLIENTFGQTYTKRGKIPLYVTTELNYQLSSWDSVFCIITDSTGTAVDTVSMDSSAGRWSGNYDPSSLIVGNYRVTYYGIYDGDTMGLIYEGWAIIETTAFHGEAAGLGAAEIADTLENRGWGLGACGIGSEEIIVKAYEAAVDSEACDNCEIKFYLVEDSDYSDQKMSAYTASNGYIPILSMDANSYVVLIGKEDWSFGIETVSVLDQDALQTFYITGTHQEIPAAESNSTTVIYGYVKDASGDSIPDAIVTIKLDMREPIVPTWTGSNDIVITELIDTTDANGEWDKEVVPNEYISPSGTRYIVTYEKEDVILEIWELIVIVPYSETPLNINDL